MSTSWFFDRQLANEPDAFTDVLALRAETNQLRARDRAWSDAVGEQHATWAVCRRFWTFGKTKLL